MNHSIEYPETIRVCRAHMRPSCETCYEIALWLEECGRDGGVNPAGAIYALLGNPIELAVGVPA